MADRRWASVRPHVLPTAAPVAVAGVAWARGHDRLAWFALGAGTVLLVARLASRGRVDAALAWVGRGIGRVLTAAAIGLFGLAVVVPAWLLGRLARVDPLGGAPGWDVMRRGDRETSPAAPFSIEPPIPRNLAQRAWSTALLGIGTVVLLLAADLGLGLASSWAFDGSRPQSTALRPETNLRDAVLGRVLADPAALGSAPWASQQAHELASLRFEYWPFLVWHVEAHRGATITTDGWVRRSRVAPHSIRPMPLVAVLGGSVAFGVGQRDEHTVASELVRLAAADDLPISVANRAQPGWGSWQSWLEFEQASAGAVPLDIGLFLAGREDAQLSGPARVAATHPEYPLVADAVDGVPPPASGAGQELTDSAAPGSSLHKLVQVYWAHSLSGRLADAFSSPPKAVPGEAAAPKLETTTVALTSAEAATLVVRARRLARVAASARRAPLVFALAPVAQADAPARALDARVRTGAVDLSHLLDGRPDAFLPDGSIDEAGATRVAEALWPRLRPLVQAWYAAHP